MKLLDTLLYYLFDIPTSEMKEQKRLEKEELKNHKAFINYKCPFCGKIFSYEVLEYNAFLVRNEHIIIYPNGKMLGKALDHKCTHKLQEDLAEGVLFTQCSVSLNPIEEAFAVSRLNEKGERIPLQ